MITDVKSFKPEQIHCWLQLCPKILGFLDFITEKFKQTAGSSEAWNCSKTPAVATIFNINLHLIHYNTEDKVTTGRQLYVLIVQIIHLGLVDAFTSVTVAWDIMYGLSIHVNTPGIFFTF